MTSKKDENVDDGKPGVKKRGRLEPGEGVSDSAKKTEEDGVVRAPKAPTTAPNAPGAKKASSGPGRRVVDPKAAAKKAEEAKEKRLAEEAKAEAERQDSLRAAKQAAAPQEQPASGDSRPETSKPAQTPQDESVGFSFAAGDVTMDDFAAMLDAEGDGIGKARRYEVGDLVEGKVVSIGERYIFVDLGGPDEGVADRGQYVDDEGNLTVTTGESLEFYVVSLRGGIQLGKEISSDGGALIAIETAHASGVPISGRVSGTNKGGFTVDIGGVEAFCPISHIELAFTEDPEVHVGNTYSFEVSEIRDGGRTVVVSRTALLEREQASRREETMKSLEVGQHLEGIITRVADFGAFVDIGGIEGLVHVSELSHVYFDKPSDIVNAGDHVKVEVMSIEEDSNQSKPLRIGLSVKAAQADPWLEVNDKFAIGESVLGTVVRLAPFGAFVEITPGVEGLVHVSEMSWKKHIHTPADVVSVGEEVQVEIQDIDLMRKRISLSMKGSENDPWRKVGDRFAIGMEVDGEVANVEDFGAFIDLGEGITALLPRSEMGLAAELTPHRKYKPTDKVKARILNIEPERRRIALTLKDADEIGRGSSSSDDKPAAPQQPRSYQDEAVSSKGTFGTLGDLLKARKTDD